MAGPRPALICLAKAMLGDADRRAAKARRSTTARGNAKAKYRKADISKGMAMWRNDRLRIAKARQCGAKRGKVASGFRVVGLFIPPTQYPALPRSPGLSFPRRRR
jgi:hypothetical protein